MATVKRLFERHSDSPGGIGSSSEWRAFESDLVGFGLCTPALTRVLAQVWAQAQADGKPVAYLALLTAIASYNPDNEAAKMVQDLRQDASALKRFVDYVRTRYKKDSSERLSLEAGED